jgi:hypothetical protein
MERVLWCLSRHCREPLLTGTAGPAVETLIWTVKSWWGVQGVRTDSRPRIAEALTTLDWSRDMFEDEHRAVLPPVPDATAFACELVGDLVQRSQAMGVPRREYSLGSKVLQWLLPWRVPVYDSFVREVVGVPPSWDHPEAYRRIVRRAFEVAAAMTEENSAWCGDVESTSPLRAFDKCLWWFDGGNATTAVEAKNPWRVVDELGLARL